MIASLFPGYFALVMATGIVSLAAYFLDLPVIAFVLLRLNQIFFGVLLGFTGARLVRYRSRVWEDFTDHQRAPGFLTTVAGACILGTQFAVMAERPLIASGLWWFGFALWVVLIYAFFLAMTVREDKPPLDAGIGGAWLLAVVSTESVAVLGVLTGKLFLSLVLYLAGGMLYFSLITLILYRWMFFPLKPEALTPPYWINMGALAILTLAGARLILAAPQLPLLIDLLPFLKGFTLFFWAAATWWIPLLAVAGIWRHAVRRVPLRYDPQYWSLVFPLGMYATASFVFSKAADIAVLGQIASGFVYLALAAWGTVFVGMLRALATGLHKKRG